MGVNSDEMCHSGRHWYPSVRVERGTSRGDRCQCERTICDRYPWRRVSWPGLEPWSENMRLENITAMDYCPSPPVAAWEIE